MNIKNLEDRDLLENTLIVISSDHGEEFLDHGDWEHQKTLYEEQLRVPLLLKLPGSDRSGERVGRHPESRR